MDEIQFSLLNEYRKNSSLTIDTIAKKTNCDKDKLNKKLDELKQAELLDGNNNITPKGYDALEPYTVDNAIIMAAGISSRFAPLCYEKPKGLLKVKGEILIERQIEQLRQAGIEKIYIVVGYMKEKFLYLGEKYGVEFITNEDYYRYNNTSTLILVSDKIRNSYICSSDNYFTQNVFDNYVFEGYYSAERATQDTDEYCLTTDDAGTITKVTVGGEKGEYYMIGHAYFDSQFSEKFLKILKSEYKTNKDTKNMLWEDLYSEHIDELKLKIKKFDNGIIKEFDSLEDLRKFDDTYINNAQSKILDNIKNVLKCEKKDIVNIETIKKGLTNSSFKFECKGKNYVYRHPGVGTEEYIHRQSEEFSMQIAKKLNLDDTYIYMDAKDGWKISHYVENARTLDYHNETEVKKALGLMKKLHDANIKSKYDFNIIGATYDFIEKIGEKGRNDFDDFDELLSQMEKLFDYTKQDGIEKRLCHCDCYDPNFLVDRDGKIYLIDWEYSGNDDPANDLGTFICCSDYTMDEAMHILELYFGRPLTDIELRHYIAYIAIASYYWYVWAIFQESVGNDVGEYLYIWYRDSVDYSKKALEMYEN